MANDGELRTTSRRLLAVGAAVGLVATVVGAVASGRPTPPTGFDGGRGESRNERAADVVAWVGEQPVSRASLEAALARLAHGDAEPTADERRATLDRLIDEELLVQRGLDLGLHRSDAGIRKTIVMEMVDAIVARARRRRPAEPSERELREHYAASLATFALPARIHVRAIYFAAADPVERAGGQTAGAAADGSEGPLVRAERALAAIERGLPFAAARERFGDAEPLPLPDAALPPHVLRRYLGPSAAERALALEPGQWSQPVPAGSGYYLLELVSEKPGAPQPFEAVADQVAASYRRLADDRALADYLARARKLARIELAASVLDGDG